jgi:hypothetical protein
MRYLIPMAIIALACNGAAWAYGGGGGGASCAEPKFFDAAPTGSARALADFKFVASDNTDMPTLAVDINGQKAKTQAERLGNGEWRVSAVPAQPLTQAGKAVIGINAKSVEGCWGFQPFIIEIKP